MMTLSEILLRDRFRAYKRLFYNTDGTLTHDAERVLADLKKFCRADRSTHTGGGSSIDMAVAEGRREVWLRIMSFLNMSEADFYQLKEDVYDEGTGATRTANAGAAGEPDFY